MAALGAGSLAVVMFLMFGWSVVVAGFERIEPREPTSSMRSS